VVGGEPYLGREVLLFQRFPLRRECDKELWGDGAFLGHGSFEVIDPALNTWSARRDREVRRPRRWRRVEPTLRDWQYRVAAAGPSLRSRGSPSSMVKAERIAKFKHVQNSRPLQGKEKLSSVIHYVGG
jgi:hypothetical protein